MAASSSRRSTDGRRKPSTRRGAGGSTATPPRDDDGRFKADHHLRNAAFGATAAIGALAAGVAAAFKFGLLDRFLPGREGHEAEDLLLDADDQRGADPKRRAPAAFRPDIGAPMTKAERDALRPPEGKPSLVAAEGEIAAG